VRANVRTGDCTFPGGQTIAPCRTCLLHHHLSIQRTSSLPSSCASYHRSHWLITFRIRRASKSVSPAVQTLSSQCIFKIMQTIRISWTAKNVTIVSIFASIHDFTVFLRLTESCKAAIRQTMPQTRVRDRPGNVGLWCRSYRTNASQVLRSRWFRLCTPITYTNVLFMWMLNGRPLTIATELLSICMVRSMKNDSNAMSTKSGSQSSLQVYRQNHHRLA